MLTQKSCVICGNTLTQVQALGGNTCANITCRTTALKKQDEANKLKKQEKEETFLRDINSKYLSYLEQNKSEKNELPLYKIPAVDSKPIELASKEKRTFLRYLLKLIRIASSDSYDLEKDTKEHIFKKTPVWIDEKISQKKWVGEICQLCAGYCCQQGEKYAYITPTMMREKLSQLSLDQAKDLYQKYKNHLPDKMINHSCMYHTTKGCALPTELRSNTCNTFFCKQSAKIIKDITSHQNKKIYVIAHNDEYIVRANEINITDESDG